MPTATLKRIQKHQSCSEAGEAQAGQSDEHVLCAKMIHSNAEKQSGNRRHGN